MAVATRDWQELVSKEVVYTTYIPHGQLKYQDHTDEWPVVTIDNALLGVTGEDGVIVNLVGTARKDLRTGSYAEVYLDQYCREFTSQEWARMAPEARGKLVANKAWDFRVVKVTETDGPERRAELMQTYEQAKLRKRNEEQGQQDTQNAVAAALAELAKSNAALAESLGIKRGKP